MEPEPGTSVDHPMQKCLLKDVLMKVETKRGGQGFIKKCDNGFKKHQIYVSNLW